jgi:hypothetical protein
MQNLKSVFTFLILSLAIKFCFAQEKSSEGFALVREEDNIFIYERWITIPKTNPPVKAREVKSVFWINASVADAVALLKNESKIKLWQDHVTEFKVYPKNDTTWHEYSYHNIPWPVSDQDHFLEYKVQDESTPEKQFITFETVVNHPHAPLREDVTRMHLSGSWLIEKVNEQKIKATYRILSRPIGIPRIITDPVIRNNMITTIKGYKEILEKKR